MIANFCGHDHAYVQVLIEVVHNFHIDFAEDHLQ